MWCSIIPPIGFAASIRLHKVFASGFGDLSTLSVPLGYAGCLLVVFGLAIRVVSVATLKHQFTTTVAIVQKHEVVVTGIYRVVRHPAYLGNLACLFGFGLLSANWLSLAVLVVLPLVATAYRIRVEEKALLDHFGSAYREYAMRTRRLLPRIY